MYQRILVPLDGSTFGEHALPLALQLVRRGGSPLHLVHVYSPQSEYPAPDFGVPIDLDSQLQAAEYQYLTRKTRSLTGLTAQSVTCAMPEGPIAEALAREARTSDTDLIVMTTHGRGAFSRFWLGSIADQLVRQASAPILLVRPKDHPPDLSDIPTLRHILIALDGEKLSEEAIEPAVNFGSLFDAHYTLLRVLRPVVDLSATFPEGLGESSGVNMLERLEALDRKLEADAEDDLERLADGLRKRGLTVTTTVTRHTQAASGILDYARSHAVDTIALATHGRHGLSRLFLGSVADKVLRGASVPVLVKRPLPYAEAGERPLQKMVAPAIPVLGSEELPVNPGCLHGR